MVNKKPISSIIITEEVEVVNKIKETNKVQHHNNLIATYSKLNNKAMRMLEIIISCIDYNNPPKDNIIYLDKTELFNILNIKNTARYTDFEEYLDEFQILFLKVFNGEERKRINITSETVWSVNKNDTKIKIELGNKIMPYLLENKKHFTQYQLMETIKLNSKHSIVLYKWLRMNYNQGVKFNNNKQKNPEISMIELRELTNTVNIYKKHFPTFEIRILKDTIEEINLKTSINVRYEKIKKGRSYEKIQFFIEEKKIEKDYLTLENVVDEESMKEYEEQESNLEKEYIEKASDNELLGMAMQNQYIQTLIKFNMIEFTDLNNIIQAYKTLIPLYDDFEKKYGKKTLDWFGTHIDYVKNNMNNPIIKETVIEYLQTAINRYENYLNDYDRL